MGPYYALPAYMSETLEGMESWSADWNFRRGWGILSGEAVLA